jgi:hypothetical protein
MRRLRFECRFLALCLSSFFSVFSAPTWGEDRVELRSLLAKQANGEEVDRSVILNSRDDLKNEERWHAGQVFVKGKWIDSSQLNEDQVTPKLQEYLVRRDVAELDLDAHRRLARWCDLNNLSQQGKAHWLAITESSSDDVEARTALGHRKIGDTWYTTEQFQEVDSNMTKRLKGIENWYPKLAKLANELSSNDTKIKAKAIQQLKKIESDDSASAIGLLITQLSPEDAMPFITALRRLDSREACLALSRVALLAQSGPAFDSAIEGLKEYRMEFYVPELLSLLHDETQLQQRVSMRDNGQLVVEQLWIANSTNEKKVEKVMKTVETSLTVVARLRLRNESPRGREIFSSTTLRTFLLQDPRLVEAKKQEVAIQNVLAKEQNDALNRKYKSQFDSVVHVLRSATGHDAGGRVSQWWDWWDKENEDRALASKRSSYNYRQLREETPIVYRPIEIRIVQQCECLVAGTLIQTAIGLKAVETLRTGDLVLSSNVTTGELSLKPVTTTTNRPPEPIIKVVSDGDVVECTAGHRWWVSGIGWVRTKDLMEGMILHTAKGTSMLKGIDITDRKEPTYNLVVADNHTYFVGKESWLSSDVTPFRPVPMKVPGYYESLSAKKIAANR